MPDERRSRLPILTVTALGVVFGDIGTSPLYAVRECFAGIHAIPATPANVLGVLSLVLWSLIVTVSIKYLLFVMRADNGGEGGILALVALVRGRARRRVDASLVAVGLFGAALLYGDGMITPAISVLSAVEGLVVVTRAFEPFVVTATVGILVLLFLFQRHGTGRVGIVFGPIMIVWFVAIAALGAVAIGRRPEVLAAVNPLHAVQFFEQHGLRGFLTLGAVFLSVTGAEALYADMGHFGRGPIRLAWFVVVLPALVINYFGQGAFMLQAGTHAHPFYGLAPSWGLYPLVALSTVATVVASQAVISGAFSLTSQAIQLGYTPRVTVQHTSAEERGQVYIPEINWLLMIATVGLVLGFRTSTNLAAAYGMAVTTTMVITTLLAYVVARQRWNWSAWRAGAVAGLFLIGDLAFFGANVVKIQHGGWFPLVVAAGVFTVMSTWKRGRGLVSARLRASSMPFERFIEEIDRRPPVRVQGTGVFMTAHDVDVPPILVHHLKHNKVLHERVVLLTVLVLDVPYIAPDAAVESQGLGHGLFRLVTRHGFMQSPDVPATLTTARLRGIDVPGDDATFYLAHLTLFVTPTATMAGWREKLFVFLSRNARRATNYFCLPPDRVVEIGIQVEL